MNLSASNALPPALLDRLFAHAPAAIAMLDHQGKVFGLSGSFTRIFGYTIEDIPHIDAWWALAYPDPRYRDDRRTVWMALMHAAISSSGEIHNYEGHVHCKDGRYIWVDAHASLTASELFIIFVDISARKQLEHDRLECLVAAGPTVTSMPEANSRFDPCWHCAEVTPHTDYVGTKLFPSSLGNSRLMGTRILLAEDNEITRLVLLSMLSEEGALVTLVENGRQAVGAVAGAPNGFDIVLMDVQMPEVDGRTATREIHRIVPALPVIGQTAHGHAAEHRECIDAGMIATIGKPIGRDDLVHLVRRYLRSASASSTTAPMPPGLSAYECATAVVDWRRLHASHAAVPELIDQLLSVALENHANTGARLRNLADASDYDEVRRIAHSLKGTAGHFFAPKLSEAARHVEATILADGGAIRCEVDALANLVDAFVRDVRARLESQ